MTCFFLRYDKYCTTELDDFAQNVRRMSSAGVVFDKKLFKERDDNFHLKFVLNFVKKSQIPVNFIWYYLDFYK